MNYNTLSLRTTWLLWLVLSLSGCWSASEQEVVVYTALDSQFSEPILKQFQQETGIRVLPKFDTESTKSVGLAEAIREEAKTRVRADVYWNNEIMNTLRLRDAGLLDVYISENGQMFPETFRGSDHCWYGFAARARVLLVNTKLVPADKLPRSIHDLKSPAWRGRVGMAKPLFGTTATHAACLFALWGEEQAKQFFRDLKTNEIQILSGNKQVAQAVSSGQIAFGLTDTDDALIEIEKGRAVTIVYPDSDYPKSAHPKSETDPLGTLFIPNTLAIMKGCPHPRQARLLVEYLLQGEIESRLALGPSGQIPLNPRVETPPRVKSPATVHAMAADFDRAAQLWPQVAKFLQEEFASY